MPTPGIFGHASCPESNPSELAGKVTETFAFFKDVFKTSTGLGAATMHVYIIKEVNGKFNTVFSARAIVNRCLTSL